MSEPRRFVLEGPEFGLDKEELLDVIELSGYAAVVKERDYYKAGWENFRAGQEEAYRQRDEALTRRCQGCLSSDYCPEHDERRAT